MSWYHTLLARDFPTFIGKTLSTADPGASYQPNWHIDLIAEYLEAARLGDIKRLIINLPPRSLKSICVSVAWPAWILGHDPKARVMAASYAASLSIKHSLDCRLTMTAPWYRRAFPQVKLARDQNEKHKFATSERGFRLATSVGGAATGEGGNYLIIDDPLSPAQAANAASRDAVNQWFDHTFASRLDDKAKGVIVLVMQRLHQHDLTGYLMNKGGWTQLALPAVARKNEYHDFGAVKHVRQPGDLLHSARENETLIARAKLELGSHAFAAQYQQEPLPEEGALIRQSWFARFRAAPPAGRIVQSWDTAIKSGDRNDASVCLTFREFEGKSYLIDAYAARLEYPDLKRMFYTLAAQYEPEAILIEDRASGQQLLQDARRETVLPLIATQPKGDKFTRVAAVCAMLEAGRLALPEQAEWLADVEAELLAFPAGAHDDRVDALAQYLNWLRASLWDRLRIRRI